MGEMTARNFLGPPCYYCKHLVAAGETLRADWWRCTVHPNGVPAPIWDRAASDAHCYESDEFDFGNGPERISYQGEWYSAEQVDEFQD